MANYWMDRVARENAAEKKAERKRLPENLDLSILMAVVYIVGCVAIWWRNSAGGWGALPVDLFFWALATYIVVMSWVDGRRLRRFQASPQWAMPLYEGR